MSTQSSPYQQHTGPGGFVQRRLPYNNTVYAVGFVNHGAQKRRQLAYQRATSLQREMGVAHGLRCVK